MILFTLQMLLEMLKETRQIRAQFIQSSLATSNVERAVESIVGKSSPIFELDNIFCMVVVPLLGMFWEEIIERFENNDVFMLRVFFMDNTETIEVSSEQTKILFCLSRLVFYINNIDVVAKGVHVPANCLVSQFHERQRTPLHFRSEYASFSNNGRESVPEGGDVGNGGDSQKNQLYTLTELPTIDGVEECRASSQCIDGKNFSPIRHGKFSLSEKSKMGESSIAQSAKNEKTDKILVNPNHVTFGTIEHCISSADDVFSHTQETRSRNPDEHPMTQAVVTVVRSHSLEKGDDEKCEPHEPSERIEESSNHDIAFRVSIVLIKYANNRGGQSRNSQTNREDHPGCLHVFDF
mmetsp:Transcript_21528/g.27839  ORF Transcript_21528/g.27839 Transcript_21528/m.27839 type:complete len:351 (-) Transcript_21528:385-1437(-)